jgi:TolB-like protein
MEYISGVTVNIGGMRDWMTGRTKTPQVQSLAVLPLENLSQDPEQEYFAEGITDALITELGQVSTLQVISRTSVRPYKNTEKSLPQIARELNAGMVVEGSVLRAGEKVRRKSLSGPYFREKEGSPGDSGETAGNVETNLHSSLRCRRCL